MNQPVILYALERRQNGAKNVFLTKSDVEGIIRIKQGDQQAPSGRRRRGAGGGAAVQGGAKNYSKKVLQFFQVLKGAGGQDILCRCVKRSGEWRWCPVVPLEELPRVIKEHHERATGFSGIKRPFGVTMYRLRSGAGVVEGMHQASRLSKAPPSLASELTFSGTAQRGVPVVSLNVAMAAQPGGGKAADDQAKLEQWLKEVAWQASEREGMETQRRQAREAAFQADLQAQSADQQLLQAQQRALELALQRAAHAEQTAARYSRELQEEKSESDQLAAQLKIQQHKNDHSLQQQQQLEAARRAEGRAECAEARAEQLRQRGATNSASSPAARPEAEDMADPTRQLRTTDLQQQQQQQQQQKQQARPPPRSPPRPQQQQVAQALLATPQPAASFASNAGGNLLPNNAVRENAVELVDLTDEDMEAAPMPAPPLPAAAPCSIDAAAAAPVRVPEQSLTTRNLAAFLAGPEFAGAAEDKRAWLNMSIVDFVGPPGGLHSDFYCFRMPVTEAEAPGYHAVIKHPMDFGTMKGKAERGQYRKPAEFRADMELIVSNARQYNEDTAHPVHKAAGMLEERLRHPRCFYAKMDKEWGGQCVH
ncbi:hypothetical protein CHLNCDRAFT_137716 [Chlorella variabilis]|uniref:Bromo domain-containing protein n=1 Tax=Chlorella variabilis TaxID=554065 RepID=E1Z4B9_CHLVA|nr:hypothetical protein CHLNCDRAFT_137716 [Chlorella variabilis]EFN59324.1 hypothetical protein CHLNCDRAFT_137716 [Chlorella variabilis]|eukprot:XP_005851426.1 hypothetical protein CHLNCDRAFT_137716 [Chlorella variabilis]